MTDEDTGILDRMRLMLAERFAKRRAEQTTQTATPPIFDGVFFDGVAALDADAAGTGEVAGEVELDRLRIMTALYVEHGALVMRQCEGPLSDDDSARLVDVRSELSRLEHLHYGPLPDTEPTP